MDTESEEEECYKPATFNQNQEEPMEISPAKSVTSENKIRFSDETTGMGEPEDLGTPEPGKKWAKVTKTESFTDEKGYFGTRDVQVWEQVDIPQRKNTQSNLAKKRSTFDIDNTRMQDLSISEKKGATVKPKQASRAPQV